MLVIVSRGKIFPRIIAKTLADYQRGFFSALGLNEREAMSDGTTEVTVEKKESPDVVFAKTFAAFDFHTHDWIRRKIVKKLARERTKEADDTATNPMEIDKLAVRLFSDWKSKLDKSAEIKIEDFLTWIDKLPTDDR